MPAMPFLTLLQWCPVLPCLPVPVPPFNPYLFLPFPTILVSSRCPSPTFLDYSPYAFYRRDPLVPLPACLHASDHSYATLPPAHSPFTPCLPLPFPYSVPFCLCPIPISSFTVVHVSYLGDPITFTSVPCLLFCYLTHLPSMPMIPYLEDDTAPRLQVGWSPCHPSHPSLT